MTEPGDWMQHSAAEAGLLDIGKATILDSASLRANSKRTHSLHSEGYLRRLLTHLLHLFYDIFANPSVADSLLFSNSPSPICSISSTTTLQTYLSQITFFFHLTFTSQGKHHFCPTSAISDWH